MKIGFNKGQEYLIEIYPTKKVVKGRYLGEAEREHFFESENSYVIADAHWTMVIDGVVTYEHISSSVISVLPKEKLDKLEDGRTKSGLIRILNEGYKKL